MVDFNSLRKNRSNNLKNLTEKVSNMTGGGGSRDERIWKPGFDKKEGKGYAVVRLLPTQHGQDPFQRVFFHSFKGPGGTYFETSRKTVDQKEDDPVAISNRLHWTKGEEEGDKSLQDVARNRKRKVRYYANVLVIKDPMNPENEGKVKVMEFGAQIFKVIEDAIKPEFEDESPIDPFDMWGGANLIIKAVGNEVKIGGKDLILPDYKKSLFDKPSELFEGDDEKKKEMFDQTHDLNEFFTIKSFDDLAARYQKVVGEAHDALSTGNGHENKIDQLTKQAEESTKEDMGSYDNEEPESKGSVEGADEKSEDDDEEDIFAQIRSGKL